MAEAVAQEVPWWGEGKKLVWSLGPVTVSFFILLAVMLGWLPSPILAVLNDNLRLSNINQQLNIEIRTSVQQHRTEMLENQKMIAKGLRAICRNTAKDQKSRDQCDELE
jgi:hypothetical protein